MCHICVGELLRLVMRLTRASCSLLCAEEASSAALSLEVWREACRCEVKVEAGTDPVDVRNITDSSIAGSREAFQASTDPISARLNCR